MSYDISRDCTHRQHAKHVKKIIPELRAFANNASHSRFAQARIALGSLIQRLPNKYKTLVMECIHVLKKERPDFAQGNKTQYQSDKSKFMTDHAFCAYLRRAHNVDIEAAKIAALRRIGSGNKIYPVYERNSTKIVTFLTGESK